MIAGMRQVALGIIAAVIFAAVAIFQLRGQPHREHYSLPCHAAPFAPSGDGTIIWFACRDAPLIGEALTAFSRATLYALELTSGRSTELAHLPGIIGISAAPVGNKVAFFWPDESGKDEMVLYRGTRRIGKAPTDAWPVAWSVDAKRMLFFGGSTIEDGDTWNILGILDLKDLTVSKRTSLEPTEGVYVCPTTGHIFAGSRETIDYDPELRSPRRITEFPPGDVSAVGSYIATTSALFHGPAPWGIFDTASRREVAHFKLTGEGQEDEYGFHSWNPRLDRLFLRIRYPAHSIFGQDTTVEMVDLAHQRILQSFRVSSDDAVWSSDGKWLITSEGSVLSFHRTASASQ
jgi:hypothetical protein